MARRHSPASLFLSPLSSLLPRGSDTLCCLFALLFILSLVLQHLPLSPVDAADSHFEGFDAEDDESLDDLDLACAVLPSPPVSQSDHTESHHGPPDPNPNSVHESSLEPQPSDLHAKSSISMEWDDDEFEGFPIEQTMGTPKPIENAAVVDESDLRPDQKVKPESGDVPRSYMIEIICCSFLIIFVINFFLGKRESESIALAWASRFATKGSIFEKNFSLVGVGDGKDEDSPLLLKECTNTFKFYASGRRYCQGLLATMELKCRHDLIARLFNVIVPSKDVITFEVFMNEEAMDHVVFAMAKKKAVKAMQKDERDLQRFANLVSPPSSRRWVAEDLGVISEAKEVAGDMITEAVLEQVFGDKAFEKYGKCFISMHFSDQHVGRHRKVLVFKFALPNAKNMAEMTRLVALVPYYIDLVGRYKLSSQARGKTEAARQKVAQEMYKELQNARQEVLQKKKAARRKLGEEAEAKLNEEAIRKKEMKERARQMKKAMPKVKMTHGH